MVAEAVVVAPAVVVRAEVAANGADVTEVVAGAAAGSVAGSGAEPSESELPSEARPRPAKRMAREISTIASARSGGPDDSEVVLTLSTLVAASAGAPS